MRSELIRIYKSVHTWTGIFAGMALFIAFYAGALTIFKDPLSRWASPPSPLYGQTFSLNDAPNLITRTLQENPKVAKDFRLHLNTAENLPQGISWQVRDQDADDHDHSSTRHYVAIIAPHGDLAITETHPETVADFIDILHRVLGLPTDTDPHRWIMGVIAILYALALFSGVVVLLPSLVKDFFAFRVGKNVKRMWLDAHNVVGIVSLPFHVVMVLTAIVFAYHDGFYLIQDKLIHNGAWSAATQGRNTPVTPTVTRNPVEMLTPANILAKAQSLSPTFEATSLQYLNVTGPRATVRVWGHDPSAHSPRFIGGFVAIDPYSGKVMNADYLPGRQSIPNAVIASFFALHFGTYGGTPMQWIYFLLGLGGAWLFYSGNLLWVETRRKKTTRNNNPNAPIPPQRNDVRWMAATTVGVCLGAICGISLTIAAAKWLYGHVEELDVWHRIIYYSVFFSALGWSFWQGAARGAVNLLWAAAVTTFAIPVTSILAWMIPSLGMWAHNSTATLGVDFTALAGGICFSWLARITQRRIKNSPTDSIWSINPQEASGLNQRSRVGTRQAF